MEAGTKQLIESALADGKSVMVKFVKKDGSTRDMLCTLNMGTIPAAQHPKGTSTKAPNPEVKNVYSVNDGGWRSFRWDSLISAEVVG